MPDDAAAAADPPRPVAGAEPAGAPTDLLSSGPERARRGGIGRRRGVRAGAVLVAAAAALAVSRSAVDAPPARVDRPVPAPVAEAVEPVVPDLPLPPFDGRPGRTRIPAPTRAGGVLSGSLPPLGGRPGRPAAVAAVRLVLGRYCLEPRAYAYTLGPDGSGRPDDWRRVTVLLFQLERGGNTPSLRLGLAWTGRGYDWSGPAELLDGC